MSEPRPSSSAVGLSYEVESDDRRVIAGLGLRLSFRRVDGRWTHALELSDAAGSPSASPLIVAEAVEHDGDRDDRTRILSPAYQDFHEHPIPDGVCLMVTGQLTPHHFSAVVTARLDGAGGVVIDFDVADRCREPLQTLGAMYLMRFGSNELSDAGTDRVAWSGPALGGRLEFAAEDPAAVSLSEAGPRASRVQALARIVPTERTQRMIYRWRWTPSSTR